MYNVIFVDTDGVKGEKAINYSEVGLLAYFVCAVNDFRLEQMLLISWDDWGQTRSFNWSRV